LRLFFVGMKSSEQGLKKNCLKFYFEAASFV